LNNLATQSSTSFLGERSVKQVNILTNKAKKITFFFRLKKKLLQTREMCTFLVGRFLSEMFSLSFLGEGCVFWLPFLIQESFFPSLYLMWASFFKGKTFFF
jgi:hypothetical protein